MRALVLIALAATVASATQAATVAPLRSGVYEGLQLAVAPDGAVAGSFSRVSDTPPARTCRFSLTGRVRPDGSAQVTVHGPAGEAALTGSLVTASDGVALHVPKLTDLPACDQLADAPPEGVTFSRIGPANGAWLASVLSARAQLHPAPDGTTWRGYLVKGDTVAVGAHMGGRWRAVFLSPAGRRSEGWIDDKDVAPYPRR